jgi:hypothetical protein
MSICIFPEAHRNAGQHSESRLRQSSDLVKPPNQQPKMSKAQEFIYSDLNTSYRRKMSKSRFFASVGILRSPKMQVMRENAGYKI